MSLKSKILLSLLVGIVVALTYHHLPTTRKSGEFKIVEYHSGKSCVFVAHDTFNQWPLVCGSIAEMRISHPLK
jgi:hypothetical protein